MTHTNLRLFAPLLALAATSASAQTAPAPTGEIIRLDAFTVSTGSNIKRLETEKALPVTIVDETQIAAVGATTVGDILQSLPQIEASAANLIGPTASNSNSAIGDTASANLRGLDDGNTLTLINGRRVASHGIAAGTPPISFVNVNQIPSAAIARIEVLRDGASAIYGADATGGVINFILKPNYEGVETRARYLAAGAGYRELSGTVALGRRFNGGRTSLNLVASYFERDPVFSRDYAFARESDHRLLVGAPFNTSVSYDLSNASGPYAKISRINTYAADGRTIANVTNFFYEPAPGGGVQFGTGTEPPRPWNVQQFKSLLGGTTRTNVFATLNHALSDKISFRSEFAYYASDAVQYTDVTAMAGNTARTGVDNIVVPASNYWNPFGTRLNPAAPRDVLIRNYRPSELGPRTFYSASQAYRTLAVVEGKLRGSWTWESGLLFGQSFSRETQYNHVSESRLYRQLALGTPDAFNPFGGPGANSQAVLDQVRVVDWTHAKRTLGSLDCKATGEVVEFWGGPIAAAVGLEARREILKETNGPFGLNDDMIQLEIQQNLNFAGNIYSGYTELNVPVVGAKNARPFLRRLEINGALRTEDYGDFRATKPKIGAQLATLPWLSLRASYGEGFRAPSLPERFSPALRRRATGSIDVARQTNAVTGAAIAPVPTDTLTGQSKTSLFSGNPAIRPENTESFNLGLIVDVPGVRGLSLTLDYWGITQKGRIGRSPLQDELNKDAEAWRANRGSVPSIIRAPRTAFDLANNIPGVLDYFDNPYTNLGDRMVQGYDVSLDYVRRTASLGRFRFAAESSTYTVFTNRNVSGTKNYLIKDDGRPKWRASGSVSWTHGNWSANSALRTVGAYYENAAFNVGGQRYRIAGWTTANLSVGYGFQDGFLKGSSVRLGANNLFDRDPPFAPQATDGYDVGNASPLGRQLYLEVRKKF